MSRSADEKGFKKEPREVSAARKALKVKDLPLHDWMKLLENVLRSSRAPRLTRGQTE